MATRPFRKGIFVSYAHADRNWLDRLQVHLAPFVRGEKLDVWDDTRILPGADWAGEIDRAIDRARVAVLLVSPEFLASQFVTQVELPAILRHAGGDLTVVWIPIRPSAFEATPLRTFEAGHDPKHPLAGLSPTQRDAALVLIAKKIAAAVDVNALGNAFRIIDAFEPQVNAFVSGIPEPEQPPKHSVVAQQVESSIMLVARNASRKLITEKDLERLRPDDQKLIRAYERTMKELFDRWTELKPKRVAQDPETKREAIALSDEVKRDLCAELTDLLGFIESMGMSLQDHYHHVRYICNG